MSMIKNTPLGKIALPRSSSEALPRPVTSDLIVISRKRDEAKRIRGIADRLPSVLAAQVRRDAAILEIEADGLERGGRSTAVAKSA